MPTTREALQAKFRHCLLASCMLLFCGIIFLLAGLALWRSENTTESLACLAVSAILLLASAVFLVLSLRACFRARTVSREPILGLRPVDDCV